jgi:glycosyltransferase involved in cell wall biosynthesis
VLWVGHLDARKDPLTAIEGFRRACGALPRARLHMVYGSAPLEAAVRERLHEDRALAAGVTLVGQVRHEELEHWYRAADLFLLASHREGANLSTMEALACGTPAVVTDLPVFRAVAGDAAAYFAPGDPGALAQALVTMWEGDDTTRASRRAAARRRFAEYLSPEAFGRRLTALYRDLIAAGIAATRPGFDNSRRPPV